VCLEEGGWWGSSGSRRINMRTGKKSYYEWEGGVSVKSTLMLHAPLLELSLNCMTSCSWV